MLGIDVEKMPNKISDNGTQNSGRSTANKIIWVIGVLRNLHPPIHANSIMSFLYIAEHEGASISDVQNMLSASSGVVSRAISLLLERQGFGKEGLGLVETRGDERDLRVKRCYLTAKGKRVWKTMQGLMG